MTVALGFFQVRGPELEAEPEAARGRGGHHGPAGRQVAAHLDHRALRNRKDVHLGPGYQNDT